MLTSRARQWPGCSSQNSEPSCLSFYSTQMPLVPPENQALAWPRWYALIFATCSTGHSELRGRSVRMSYDLVQEAERAQRTGAWHPQVHTGYREETRAPWSLLITCLGYEASLIPMFSDSPCVHQGSHAGHGASWLVLLYFLPSSACPSLTEPPSNSQTCQWLWNSGPLYFPFPPPTVHIPDFHRPGLCSYFRHHQFQNSLIILHHTLCSLPAQNHISAQSHFSFL